MRLVERGSSSGTLTLQSKLDYFHRAWQVFIGLRLLDPHITWEQEFHRAREAGYGNPVSVSKHEVGSIPPGFTEAETTVDFLTVYTKQRSSEELRIYDVLTHYLIKIEQNQPFTAVGSTAPKQRTETGTGAGAAVAGGAFLLGAVSAVGLGVAAVANAFSGSQSQSTAEQVEQRVFISHSWKYNDHREELTELLDRERAFEWRDYSVSSDDPIDAQLDNHLRKKLRDQIRPTSVVLCLAGMYAAHSNWIGEELQIANEMGKPILGIRPPENKRTPNVVSEHADEIVPLDRKAVRDAINRHTA